MDDGLKFFALFFGFVITVFVAIVVTGMVKLARRRRAHAELTKDGVRGVATVVDNRITSHSNTDGPDSLTFQAVVVLDQQDDARPVVLTDEVHQSYVVGSKIDVIYDPANPSRVEAVKPPSVAGYVVGAVMLVLVSGFSVAAIAMFRSMSSFE